MSRVTSKGQVTIPQNIREKFGFMPGTDVKVIADGGRAVIMKSRPENQFMKWLGRGRKRDKKAIDLKLARLRGRTDD